MRLAPVPMFYYPDLKKVMHFSIESAKTTHAADECLWANQLFAHMLFLAFEGKSKNAILSNHSISPLVSPGIKSIIKAEYQQKNESEIKGSAYVVESLEAALWSFYSTDSYQEAILQAANLGDDADTTASICGQIAGAYYGINNIPKYWIEQVFYAEKILNMANALFGNNHH
jgi:ADP-ribosyl-[dinitrogen reductase] hydrolase